MSIFIQSLTHFCYVHYRYQILHDIVQCKRMQGGFSSSVKSVFLIQGLYYIYCASKNNIPLKLHFKLYGFNIWYNLLKLFIIIEVFGVNIHCGFQLPESVIEMLMAWTLLTHFVCNNKWILGTQNIFWKASVAKRILK